MEATIAVFGEITSKDIDLVGKEAFPTVSSKPDINSSD